jgi:tetracycline 7-halogenase / FADH2 O2-dependent halogenase
VAVRAFSEYSAPVSEGCFDLAIVGSAFGGSLLAMIARRLGRSVVLIERGRHPRFAIGESSTPLANLLLEELAVRYRLPRLLPLTQWGALQLAYPEIGCGLKRGFSFYHHAPGRPWCAREDRANELLVAASPSDEIADTHWYRPDFDHWFQREAVALGVEYHDGTELRSFSEEEDGVRLDGVHAGLPVTFRARWVVDASGPRGFLSRALGLEESPWTDYPATQALYSHFEGVRCWADLHPSHGTPPYPPDDAALHHVFDGGWMWVLRFNNGLTSAGVSVNAALAEELRLSEGARAWQRVMDRFPSVAAQFEGARPVREFTQISTMPFRSAVMSGDRWALLPSAAGFVDPMLSTGFPLTLLGIERLAHLLESSGVPDSDALASYAAQTRIDLDAAAALIGGLHRNLGRPEIFQPLSLLYFAAAIFAETSRRLGRPAQAGGFLLRGRPDFARGVDEVLRLAAMTAPDLSAVHGAVHRTLEPVNLAGLGRAERRNWYPVQVEDLFESADKVGATRSELEAMLRKCGISPQWAMPVGVDRTDAGG